MANQQDSTPDLRVAGRENEIVRRWAHAVLNGERSIEVDGRPRETVVIEAALISRYATGNHELGYVDDILGVNFDQANDFQQHYLRPWRAWVAVVAEGLNQVLAAERHASPADLIENPPQVGPDVSPLLNALRERAAVVRAEAIVNFHDVTRSQTLIPGEAQPALVPSDAEPLRLRNRNPPLVQPPATLPQARDEDTANLEAQIHISKAGVRIDGGLAVAANAWNIAEEAFFTFRLWWGAGIGSAAGGWMAAQMHHPILAGVGGVTGGVASATPEIVSVYREAANDSYMERLARERARLGLPEPEREIEIEHEHGLDQQIGREQGHDQDLKLEQDQPVELPNPKGWIAETLFDAGAGNRVRVGIVSDSPDRFRVVAEIDEWDHDASYAFLLRSTRHRHRETETVLPPFGSETTGEPVPFESREYLKADYGGSVTASFSIGSREYSVHFTAANLQIEPDGNDSLGALPGA